MAQPAPLHDRGEHAVRGHDGQEVHHRGLHRDRPPSGRARAAGAATGRRRPRSARAAGCCTESEKSIVPAFGPADEDAGLPGRARDDGVAQPVDEPRGRRRPAARSSDRRRTARRRRPGSYAAASRSRPRRSLPTAAGDRGRGAGRAGDEDQRRVVPGRRSRRRGCGAPRSCWSRAAACWSRGSQAHRQGRRGEDEQQGRCHRAGHDRAALDHSGPALGQRAAPGAAGQERQPEPVDARPVKPSIAGSSVTAATIVISTVSERGHRDRAQQPLLHDEQPEQRDDHGAARRTATDRPAVAMAVPVASSGSAPPSRASR